MKTVRTHVWISGTVQGVCFRESTREQAANLGVFGWIKNLPDGRVEAVLEGEEKAVALLLAYIRKGPELAVVDHLQVSEEQPSGDLTSFAVLKYRER